MLVDISADSICSSFLIQKACHVSTLKRYYLTVFYCRPTPIGSRFGIAILTSCAKSLHIKGTVSAHWIAPHNYLIPIAELPCYPLLSLDAVLPVCAWFPYSLHSNSDTHREYGNVVQTITEMISICMSAPDHSTASQNTAHLTK